MPSGGAHDVFISYASGDKAVAEQVCASLEGRGLRCWIAPRNARPGINYGASIVDAIDASPVLVFVVSSQAVASPHVQREVERAANTGVHVIPFRIEDVPLSKTLQYFLEGVHWLDAFTPPLERHLDDLSEAVTYFLSSRAPATSGSGSGGRATARATDRQAEEHAGAVPGERTPYGGQSSATPAPRPGSHRAQDALFASIPSFSVAVLRASVVGAAAGACLAAVAALFTKDAGPIVALAFVVKAAVLSGLITTAWLVGTSLPGQRAALLGGVAGVLGGWMAESLVTQVWPLFTYMRVGGAWTVAGIVQWVAFGLAGGFIIDRTRPTRPAVVIAIALVVASVARTLVWSWSLPHYYPLRDFLLRNPLLIDLPVALGWGVGLVLCPPADASLRRPPDPEGPARAG